MHTPFQIFENELENALFLMQYNAAHDPIIFTRAHLRGALPPSHKFCDSNPFLFREEKVAEECCRPKGSSETVVQPSPRDEWFKCLAIPTTILERRSALSLASATISHSIEVI